MSETKALTGVSIKDADAGTVQAVFATLGVIDKDGDVTTEGAFQDGEQVRISAFGHTSWHGHLPVGKGVIREVGNEAILDGQFFLNTQHGRDTFETVKGLAGLGEWSYGYDILEADNGQFEGKDVQFLRKLKVHEVSPVLLGAGENTRTLAVKQQLPPFSDQATQVLGDLEALVNRAKAFGSQSEDMERKEGRVLSAANRERLATLLTALGEAGVSISELLDETDPNKARENMIRLEAEFLRVAI
jgi:hypothetical protein